MLARERPCGGDEGRAEQQGDGESAVINQAPDPRRSLREFM